MPLYPFILLVAIFLLVVIVPPLVAAFLDQQREALMGSSEGEYRPYDDTSNSQPAPDNSAGTNQNNARRDDSRG